MKKNLFIIGLLLLMSSVLFGQTIGDVNTDSIIDIADALMVAQYTVELNPGGFNQGNANVNCDSSITIVDALIIAQYYGRLVTSFPCAATPTPTRTAAPTITPTATTTGQGSWQLIWSDEFSGSGLPNASSWNINQWNPGTVNSELQKYTTRTENLRQENGMLVIEARNDYWSGYSITSGRIESFARWVPDASTSYKIEAYVKMPSGGGTWPAFWLLGNESGAYGGWPNCGEIDIVEYVGNNVNWFHSAVHTNASLNIALGGKTVSNSETSFHLSAVELYNDRVDFYVDGALYLTYKPSNTTWSNFPFNNPTGNGLNIILNMAIGGMMGGTVDYSKFPFYFYVDYVRVYKK